MLQQLITVLKSGLLVFQKNFIAKRQLGLGFENNSTDDRYKCTVNYESGAYTFELPFKHKSRILDHSYNRSNSRIQIICDQKNKENEKIKIEIKINNVLQSKKIASDLSDILSSRLKDLINADRL